MAQSSFLMSPHHLDPVQGLSVGNCVTLHFYMVNFFSKVCLRDWKVLSIWHKGIQYFYNIKNNFTQRRCHSHIADCTRKKFCPTARVRCAVPTTLLYLWASAPDLAGEGMLPRSRAPIAFPSPWSRWWKKMREQTRLEVFSPPLFLFLTWPRKGRGKCPGAQPWSAKRREVLWAGFPSEETRYWVAEGMGRRLPHKSQVGDRYTARRSPVSIIPSTHIFLMVALKRNLKCSSGQPWDCSVQFSLVKVTLFQFTTASGRKVLPCPCKMTA